MYCHYLVTITILLMILPWPKMFENHSHTVYNLQTTGKKTRLVWTWVSTLMHMEGTLNRA
jgi:hypothetical protein